MLQFFLCDGRNLSVTLIRYILEMNMERLPKSCEDSELNKLLYVAVDSVCAYFRIIQLNPLEVIGLCMLLVG